MTVAAFDQAAFRGRNDDGSETLATWKQPVNTNWTQEIDKNFRVRFLVQETAGGMSPNAQIQLQYNHELAGWIDANDTSLVVRSSTSIHFTDGDTTSQQLGSGTFIEPNGGMDDANGVAGEGNEIDFTANTEVEAEFCCQLRSADVNDGDSVQLRVLVDGNLPAQTNVPDVTAAIPQTVTKTASLNSALQDTITGTASLNAAVEKTVTATVSLSASLQVPLVFADTAFGQQNSFQPPLRIGTDLYWILLDKNDASRIAAFKSTDDGATWDNIGEFNFTNTVLSVWVRESGSDLHVFTIESTTGRVGYSVFDPGSASWTTENELAAEPGAPTEYTDVAPNFPTVTGALRADGDVAVVFTGEVDTALNTDNTLWARRESSVWTQEVITSSANENRSGSLVGPDASDRLYLLREVTQTILGIVTIKADNTRTFSNFDTTFDTAGLTIGPGVIDSSGESWVPYIDASNKISVVHWTAQDDPDTNTIEADVGDNTVFGHGRATPPFCAACLVVDPSDNVYLLYADDTSQDIFLDAAVTTGGETDTEIIDAVTCNRISAAWDSVNSEILIGYDDGGTVVFATHTPAQATTITADLQAALQDTFSLTLSASGALQKQDQTVTASLDAGKAVLASLTGSLDSALAALQTIDASLSGALADEFTSTTSLSGALQVQQTLIASLNAAKAKTETLASNLEAALQDEKTGEASLNAAIQKELTAALSLTGALQATATGTVNLSGALAAAIEATASLQAALEATVTNTASLDGVLQDSFTVTASINGALQAAQTATASLDAALFATVTLTASVNAALEAQNTLTASASGALRDSFTGTASLDASLALPGSETKTVDASLNAAMSALQTLTASLNGALQTSQSITGSLSGALAKEQTLTSSLSAGLSQTATGTVDLSSVLQKSFTLTGSLTGALQNTLTVTGSLSGALQASQTRAVSLNAWLALTATESVSLGSVLQAAITRTAVLNGAVRGEVSVTASMNASVTAALVVDPSPSRTFSVPAGSRVASAGFGRTFIVPPGGRKRT